MGIVIFNGQANGIIPQVNGCKEFLNEINDLIPFVRYGEFNSYIVGGINSQSQFVGCKFTFVNGFNLDVRAKQEKGNKYRYTLNGNTVDRVTVLSELSKLKTGLIKFTKLKPSADVINLWNKLHKYCQELRDGGVRIYDKVTSGGSEDRWSSNGEKLEAYFEGNRISFIYYNVDCGSDYKRGDYDNTKKSITYYPDNVSIQDIINTVAQHGVRLPL